MGRERITHTHIGVCKKESEGFNAPLLIVLCCIIVPDHRGARDIQKKRFPKWEKEIGEMDKELYSFLYSEEHQTKIPGSLMSLQALEYGIYLGLFEDETEKRNFEKDIKGY